MNKYTVIVIDDHAPLTYHVVGSGVERAIECAREAYEKDFKLKEPELEIYAVFPGHLENLYVR